MSKKGLEMGHTWEGFVWLELGLLRLPLHGAADVCFPLVVEGLLFEQRFRIPGAVVFVLLGPPQLELGADPRAGVVGSAVGGLHGDQMAEIFKQNGLDAPQRRAATAAHAHARVLHLRFAGVGRADVRFPREHVQHAGSQLLQPQEGLWAFGPVEVRDHGRVRVEVRVRLPVHWFPVHAVVFVVGSQERKHFLRHWCGQRHLRRLLVGSGRVQ